MVVSKTRNGVTRNSVTGLFPFFSSFNLLLLTLFICLPFFYCLFFPVEKKSLTLSYLAGFSAPFSQIYRIPRGTFFCGPTFSHFREVGLFGYLPENWHQDSI